MACFGFGVGFGFGFVFAAFFAVPHIIRLTIFVSFSRLPRDVLVLVATVCRTVVVVVVVCAYVVVVAVLCLWSPSAALGAQAAP